MSRTTSRRCAFSAEEAAQHADAVASAEQSLALATTRYQAGITTYLEVITAQSAALANQITAANILTRRMTASVLLIKALGGGGQSPASSRLPREGDAIHSRHRPGSTAAAALAVLLLAALSGGCSAVLSTKSRGRCTREFSAQVRCTTKR